MTGPPIIQRQCEKEQCQRHLTVLHCKGPAFPLPYVFLPAGAAIDTPISWLLCARVLYALSTILYGRETTAGVSPEGLWPAVTGVHGRVVILTS